MSSFSMIQQKLEQFIKKYYTSELIKGTILFFAIGLLYLIITLLVEYFLWLNTLGRTILFWAFVLVETALFVRFIAIPLLKLFNIQQGITHEDASKLIGNHFPEVSDKLLNVIQLNQNQRESELLLASIDQKSSDLQPIPFKTAINFKTNSKYLKYAAIPIIIFLLFTALGDKDIFSSSYKRVVNYDTTYEPPAPFVFQVLNNSLTAIENKNYTLKIKTVGDYVPENASISFNDQTYYLKQGVPGVFEYTFLQPTKPIDFSFKANQVSSKMHTLNIVKTPSLVNFKMKLNYPSYTGKKDEIIESSGNAIIPQGTKVTWDIQTKNTDHVVLKTKDSSHSFLQEQENFNFKKRVFNKLDYAITTSNKNLKDYENLSFTLGVIRDEYPEIKVASKQDSTDSQKMYFLGNVSDDYGLTKLQLVYYPLGEEENKQRILLTLNASNFDQFVYDFPGNLTLTEGTSYDYYFQVFDNDAIHNFKSSKSAIYSFRKLTQDEIENEQLQKQEKTIKGLDKSLENMKLQDKTLEEISKNQKEKNQLNWNDKKKLKKFLKKQEKQEEMMRKFSKELKENLENFQPENKEEDPFKEQLKERFQENEEQLKKNEKLLDKLEKLQEKIEKEELTDKLEKLSKQNKNQEKNLEQLVELTKRYYVTKKAEKLAEELNKLAEEQEKLANAPEEENTKDAQEELNKKFEEYTKEKEELQKDNKDLKDPMDIPDDKKGEEEVKEEQEKASDNLDKGAQKAASKSQKKASQKMKQMGKQMQMQMQSGQLETLDEDLEMLRQILDNLVVFSFEQEDLMGEFKVTDYGSPLFGKKLIKQNDLKQNFKHVDDSIFALSLRQPMLGGKINESLTGVIYNLEKSLERLAENEIRKGISSQQYTVTGANELAILLSDILGSMQDQMSSTGKGKGKGKGMGKGEGEGKGFQLPDIIKKQEGLNEKMKEGLGKKGKKGEEGEGKEGDGKGEGEGQGEGKGQGKGENGKNGKDGKQKGEESYGNEEDLNGKLFEIFKEQQMLRQQLQDKINQLGDKGNAGDLLREMEYVEQQLLEKGFDQNTLEKMQNLQHELLKLDKATFEQGQEMKRESKTNRKSFENNIPVSPEDIKKYFNSTEILNREALPLHLEYKQKVREYFKNKDD